TDLSRGAQQALRHAVVLADRLGAELHVLHVINGAAAEQRSIAPVWEAEAIRIAMEADVHRHHRDLMERWQPGKLTTRCAVRRGDDIAQAILEYSEELQIDLIVLHWYENEVSEPDTVPRIAHEVARRARCDVLTSGIRAFCDTGRRSG